MARTLEQLQKQYNSAAASAKSARGPGMHGPGGPGGHGPRGGGMGGKPKDTKKTMRRLLGYMRPYWLRFLLVLLCMLVSTATSLLGSYLLAPVIDKLTLAVFLIAAALSILLDLSPVILIVTAIVFAAALEFAASRRSRGKEERA